MKPYVYSLHAAIINTLPNPAKALHPWSASAGQPILDQTSHYLPNEAILKERCIKITQILIFLRMPLISSYPCSFSSAYSSLSYYILLMLIISPYGPRKVANLPLAVETVSPSGSRSLLMSRACTSSKFWTLFSLLLL